MKAFTRFFVEVGERATREPIPLVVDEEEARARELVAALNGFDAADAEIAAVTVRLTLMPRSMTRARHAPLKAAGASIPKTRQASSLILPRRMQDSAPALY